MNELFADFLIAVCGVVAFWLSWHFYKRLFRGYWELLKLLGRRVQFYVAWFSFLHQRRKIERFQALADRLWRRNQAREIADRNVLPRS